MEELKQSEVKQQLAEIDSLTSSIDLIKKLLLDTNIHKHILCREWLIRQKESLEHKIHLLIDLD